MPSYDISRFCKPVGAWAQGKLCLFTYSKEIASARWSLDIFCRLFCIRIASFLCPAYNVPTFLISTMITPLDVCTRILVLTPAVSGPPRRVVWWAVTSLTWKTSRTASHQSLQILKEKCKENGNTLPSEASPGRSCI